jgi:hypothetical protein
VTSVLSRVTLDDLVDDPSSTCIESLLDRELLGHDPDRESDDEDRGEDSGGDADLHLGFPTIDGRVLVDALRVFTARIGEAVESLASVRFELPLPQLRRRDFTPSYAVARTEAADVRELELAVARLDVVAPDWRDRVRADDVDMANPCRCVLGQVFGGYDRGRYALYGLPHVGPGSRAFHADFPARLWREELAAAGTRVTA